MASKLTVVISQAQGKNPGKRQLEEELAARLIMEAGIDVSVVPHLYDLSSDHTGTLFLRSVPGNLVVLGWMYPRALRWVLDRQEIRGQEGLSLLEPDDVDEDELEELQDSQGIGSVDVPDRRIYCLDLRTTPNPTEYIDEIRRIRQENSQSLVNLLGWIEGSPSAPQMERYLDPLPIVPTSERRNGTNGYPNPVPPASPVGEGQPQMPDAAPGQLQDFTSQTAERRWYPVIDYSRCTNCMECIDFCLFGVYGVDTLDRILVEAQDNCKKGCPACSRVCPENAILFPQHKTPAIAGAAGEVAGLKIDLSELFGGTGKDALELAVAERDAELVKEGRHAVGMEVGIPKRQCGTAVAPRDELDDLMDGLDALDA
ncbi:MAG: ATP-binding protein [Planctomycetaceae bacterium]